jgi:TPP-dependent indolepyruvate ferredoxin oxidoreductase alpha subunit
VLGVQVAAAYPGTPSTEIVTNAMITIAESDGAAERRGRRTRRRW